MTPTLPTDPSALAPRLPGGKAATTPGGRG